MRPHFSKATVVLASMLISGHGAAGRGPAPQSGGAQAAAPSAPSAVPTSDATLLHTGANLVLVDVVVTDRGNPVHSIDRSKFHIFEDGREQTLTTFDEHRGSTAPKAAPNVVKLPPGTFSNIPAYPDSGVVNVLLLDALNTPVASQLDLHRQMIDYLGKIQPGTSLAIFTLASRLRMVEGFTTDPSRLTKALQSSKAGPQQSVALDPETEPSSDETLEEFQSADMSAFAVASLQQFTADVAAFQIDMRVRMTLDALQELGRYLSAIPGRKNLIWFSGSFPIALDPDDTLMSPFQAMRDYSDDARETANLLSAARVAVYPVDARGLMPLPAFEASYKGSGNAARGGNVAKDNSKFMQKTRNEQATMQQIAEQTGGQDYVNTNGLKEAVASAVENGSSYYTVGYVPSADKLNGQFHKIQLKLDAGGYKLAYRRGYYADAPGKSSVHNPGKPNMIAEAASHGMPLATQILFQARVLRATDPLIHGANLSGGPAGEMAATLKGPVSRCFVELRVDPNGIAFDEAPEGAHRAGLEFAAIAYGADGNRANYLARGVELNLKTEQYERLTAVRIPAVLALDLPAGKFALRIVVAERAASRAGSLEIPVTIPAK
jgi:VWFA-related protein